MTVQRAHHGYLQIEEVPEPEAGANDVVLAVKAVGVCGSDLHTYLHGLFVQPGQIMEAGAWIATEWGPSKLTLNSLNEHLERALSSLAALTDQDADRHKRMRVTLERRARMLFIDGGGGRLSPSAVYISHRHFRAFIRQHAGKTRAKALGPTRNESLFSVYASTHYICALNDSFFLLVS